MSTLEDAGAHHGLVARFDGAAASKPETRKRKGRQKTPSVSLRLSEDERAQLERRAGGVSLSAYIRGQLFGQNTAPRRKGARRVIEDHAALGRVLEALGRSGLSDDLGALSWSVESGVLHIDQQTAAAIHRACSDIAAMRADLLRALGKRP